jgi:tripartite-type tricarboxylate transporter receptor subunit TctC
MKTSNPLSPLLAFVTVLAISAGIAFAQDFPSRTVRGVVAFGPGGVTDSVARIIAQKLSDKWGQPLIIENRAGAGGNIGTELVTKSAPDGYTINFATQALTINQVLMPSKAFHAMDDLSPVSLLGWSDFVLLVHPSVPARSVDELIAYAKANPEKMSYGASSLQGAYAMEQFKAAASIKIERVPYKELSNVIADLLAGRLHAYFTPIAPVLGYLESKQLIPLAVSPKGGVPVLPGIRSIKEWLPTVEAATWYALLAPANTPRQIVDKLNADMKWVLEQHDVREGFAKLAVRPERTTPAGLREVLLQDMERVQDLERRGVMKAVN